ncbi:ParM/StbA family protein [Oscillospiraceae bacterium 44-5]
MLIAIDHGNKLIKVPNHEPFTSGLEGSDVPPFAGETLKYQGKYYTRSEKRIPYHRDKTEDERFFILSLFAIAYEIEAAGGYSQNVMRIQLAVGLPPAHFGAQNKAFTEYFTGRGVVQFEYQKRPYSIYIEKTMCFPQSYAAAVTILKSLRDKPKALIVDQGGMTTDFLLLKDGVGDLSVCDSLEHGVITLYNKIKSKVSAELDILMEDRKSTPF